MTVVDAPSLVTSARAAGDDASFGRLARAAAIVNDWYLIMRNTRSITGAMIVALAAALGCGDTGATGPGGGLPPTAAHYDLVFESRESVLSNQPEIFRLRDGTVTPERIFPEFAYGGQPTTTADGRWLAYVGPGLDDDPQDIWIARPDGSDRHRVPMTPGIEYAPAISPDGSRLAYIKVGAHAISHLWTIGVDGSDERQITVALPGVAIAHGMPVWSPDGRRLVFSSGAPGKLGLWMIDANGTHLTQLTQSAVSDVEPTWSPDGKHLAFVRTVSPAIGDIVVLELATRRERALGLPLNNRQPAWSPDGKRIAFSSNLDGGADSELYTITPDGTGLTRLTDNEVNDRRPAWLAVPR